MTDWNGETFEVHISGSSESVYCTAKLNRKTGIVSIEHATTDSPPILLYRDGAKLLGLALLQLAHEAKSSREALK